MIFIDNNFILFHFLVSFDLFHWTTKKTLRTTSHDGHVTNHDSLGAIMTLSSMATRRFSRC